MRVDVKWSKRASQELRDLPPALQQEARDLARNLLSNPYIGEYTHTVHLSDGSQAYVHTYAGLRVIVEFYRRGLFRRTIVIVIHSVRPMDWPSQTDYEDRTRP
jgi:mRNA-degrading endonuclease RelE of RelBE toxin-antitoxin system